jgi:hypothetical protein
MDPYANFRVYCCVSSMCSSSLYHYQRSVACRLCYCLCFLLCGRCHSDNIFFLNLHCHPSDSFVCLIRYTDTNIHHNDAHHHVWFFSCTNGALNCNQLRQWRLRAVGFGTLFILLFLFGFFKPRGTRWCSWLRHCTARRKVAGSIPDGVSGIFHWHNPSGRTMTLGLTQPLTEMSTRNISWG